MAHSRAALASTPAPALADSLRRAGIRVDGAGYVGRFEDALLPSLSESTRKAIEADLAGKRGSELVRRKKGLPKFYAAHSSAALAANTFGPFLRGDHAVPIGGKKITGETALERECRTRLRGTPPTLDFLIDGAEVLAVESKCIEPFSSKAARFSDAYGDEMRRVHRSWREEYDRLVEDPFRYRHLDAAQLIKHYLGLKTQFGDRPITLAYLYWLPADADELVACSIHRAEVNEFATRVADPRLTFTAIDYTKLWADWSRARRPAWLREHAAALQSRYTAAVRSNAQPGG